MFATITLAPFAVAFHADQATAETAADGTDSFVVTSEADLTELTKAQLTQLYVDSIPEGSNIDANATFRTKADAAKAVFANLTDRAETPAQEADETPAEEKAAEPKARKLSKGINLAPKAKTLPCRAGTKQAVILDLISRPQGATMQELRDALSHGKPWLDVTIKSGLSWDMNSVKGYGIRTTVREENGQEVHAYHAVFPEGQTGPLAHTPRAADKKAAEAEAKAKAEAEAKAATPAEEPAPAEEAAA
jgi:hypothetical protein